MKRCQPYHLTPEQLRIVYQEKPIDYFFAVLARTRIAMLDAVDRRMADNPDSNVVGLKPRASKQ